MLALQIQAVILAVVWFAIAALNNSGNGLLWALIGGVVFTVVHVVFVYLLDSLFYPSLTGAVAANGIYFLSRMVAIIIGFTACYLVLQALTKKGAAARA